MKIPLLKTLAVTTVALGAAFGCVACGARETNSMHQAQGSHVHEAVHEAPAEKPSRAQSEADELDTQGSPFTITWTRTPPVVDRATAEPSRTEFNVVKLGASPNAYALYFEIKPGLHGDLRIGSAERPVVQMNLDGCPVKTPPALNGLIRFGQGATALTLSRQQLSKGDIEIIVTAHGLITSIQLRHDDDGIRPVAPEELPGYHVIPGDPAKAEPGVAVNPSPEQCP